MARNPVAPAGEGANGYAVSRGGAAARPGTAAPGASGRPTNFSATNSAGTRAHISPAGWTAELHTVWRPILCPVVEPLGDVCARAGSSSTVAAAKPKRVSTNGDVSIPLHPTEPRENNQESGDRGGGGGDEQTDSPSASAVV